jgi:hypothetical protein
MIEITHEAAIHWTKLGRSNRVEYLERASSILDALEQSEVSILEAAIARAWIDEQARISTPSPVAV